MFTTIRRTIGALLLANTCLALVSFMAFLYTGSALPPFDGMEPSRVYALSGMTFFTAFAGMISFIPEIAHACD
jgi:hypothetical protein